MTKLLHHRRDRRAEVFAFLRSQAQSRHDPKIIAATLDMSLQTVYRHLKTLVRSGVAQVADGRGSGPVGYQATLKGPVPPPLSHTTVKPIKWSPTFQQKYYARGGFVNATVGGFSPRFTMQEDDLIMNPRGMRDKDLAAFLRRSMRAIQIRRSRLRKRREQST